MFNALNVINTSNNRSYCNYQVRCVRCGGTHLSTECQKRPDDDPTCANCEGKHPANYRGCSIHKQLQQLRRGGPIVNNSRNMTKNPQVPGSAQNQSGSTFRTISDNGQNNQINCNQANGHARPSGVVNDSVNKNYSSAVVNNNNNNNNNVNVNNMRHSRYNNDNSVNTHVHNSNVSYAEIVNSSSHTSRQSSKHFASSHSPSYTTHFNPPHYSSSQSHQQTANDITPDSLSLTTLLEQVQRLLQPLTNLINQLAYATQALIKQNGH